ncbi:MAG TPA: nicotinate-nucleotide adenylyltransferase [Vicinamibacterales bacterium]|nr:nicotinate-nucleotide adenylyltransferase [Vicinamibacterales bacterium]
MTSHARIGILGGTLDPVHTGHLEAAEAARGALALDRVIFLPTRVPPHRPSEPAASSCHRFAMASLAVNGVAGFEASDLELRAPGPSYTADTLGRLHQSGLVPAQIFFITGADAFAEIDTWHRFPEVLDMSHFVVVSRPGHEALALRTRLPRLADRMAPGTRVAAQASQPSIFLVDARTADVSSTDIRRRLSAGEPVHRLVPPSVETHIRQHGLYSSRGTAGWFLKPADHLHGKD